MSGVRRSVSTGHLEAARAAELAARATASYDWLTNVNDALHWVELDPRAGRTVVMSAPTGQVGPACRRDTASEGVGSSLHAYGGTPFAVLPSGEVVSVDALTGQIEVNRSLTSTSYCYGDLIVHDGELLCVREDEAGDELVAITPSTTGERVLRRTDGFLASPRSRLGHLAWSQWSADEMPWDSSEIWVAAYKPGGELEAPERIAGGRDESAIQPVWSPDGALYFLSDRTGWWNLYRWRDGRTEAVAPMVAECATAPWESGYANFTFLTDGRIALTVQQGPRHELVVVHPDGGVRPVAMPYTFIKPYLAGVGDRVAIIGASPTQCQEIALVATDGSDSVEVVRAADRHIADFPLSIPETFTVRSAAEPVTVLLYPPANGDVRAPTIVRPHAGPTYHSNLRLDWEVQFFTAQGFAVADVDYRGSTGYGRAFRKMLDGNWGRRDVEDCRNVAQHLISIGRAAPDAVFISGASAGGYTALRSVCEDGPFRLAVARSAIVDPMRWTTTAPRFQRPHAARLASDAAEVTADRIRQPVLLIHGDRDAVAPIADVVALADGLRARGRLISMLELEDVGHYLSAPTALAAALEAELAAYRAAIADIN